MLALHSSDTIDASQSLFRLLLNNLPNSAAALYDDTLRIQCAGGELLPVFGLGEDIEGRHVSELFGPPQAEIITRWFVTALNGQPVITLWPLAEKLYSITVRAVEVPHDSTAVLGIVLVQDAAVLTAEQSERLHEEQRRAALTKDLELVQAKARMIDRILHEFRNPLAALASSAEILEQYDGTLTRENRQKHVSRIGAEVHRLAAILDDILSLIS